MTNLSAQVLTAQMLLDAVQAYNTLVELACCLPEDAPAGAAQMLRLHWST